MCVASRPITGTCSTPEQEPTLAVHPANGIDLQIEGQVVSSRSGVAGSRLHLRCGLWITRWWWEAELAD